ncbi:DNA-polymerase III [Mocis latipes granulovirus]|uniref:DNA-polymerase III n=1 Tax=Mocis latipes granulovirus TaxID=2072024 RepID=A0A2I6UI32_9BBAC|nr:DNA-polymerase III [Mocis latipes granulovirus]AUO79646.1 DNA-polymerase III [Mocis latipes granulovirus]
MCLLYLRFLFTCSLYDLFACKITALSSFVISNNPECLPFLTILRHSCTTLPYRTTHNALYTKRYLSINRSHIVKHNNVNNFRKKLPKISTSHHHQIQ